MKEFGAAYDALGPSGDLEKTRRWCPGKTKPNSIGDDILSRSDYPTPKQFCFEGILGSMFSIYLETIYFHFLIWREFYVQYTSRRYIYTFRFEENKFIIVYILRKYTFRFEENKFIIVYILRKYILRFEENKFIIVYIFEKIYF